jgi:hypothetical protein
MCDGLYKAHRNACKLREMMIGRLSAADKLLEEKQIAYLKEQRRREEEIKARQRAEDERVEREKRDRLAKELELAGAADQAKAVAEAPLDIPEPQVPSLAPKAQGEVRRRLWRVTSVDVVALATHVVANPVLKTFLAADISALNKYISDADGKVVIPGVKFEQKDSIGVKR